MNPLGLPLIDAHTAQLQRERIAAQLATLLPSPLPLPKRLVGRPKRQLDASSILAAAAKVVYSGSVEESDKHASKKARGHYTDWFASPYIHDILAAFRRNNFQARQTVIALQKSTPDGRYDRLNHSTILGWHDSITHQLLPRFQQLLHAGASSSRGAGNHPSLFEGESGSDIELQVKDILLKMRGAGTAIDSNVIRWVMTAVMKEKGSPLLDRYKLSRTYICRWAHITLAWSWRARTTASSKLPLNWEELGVKMTMRIAANMEIHKVCTVMCDQRKVAKS